MEPETEQFCARLQHTKTLSLQQRPSVAHSIIKLAGRIEENVPERRLFPESSLRPAWSDVGARYLIWHVYSDMIYSDCVDTTCIQ